MELKSLKFIVLVSVIIFSSCSSKEVIHRETDFNFNWKFTLLQDTTSIHKTPLNDEEWRDIRLPHDWSVEHSFDSIYEGATGYLPGGVAYYQKHFKTPINKDSEKAYILFDGVYNNAKFWLNGAYLGENPYGYSPVYFDISDKLKSDDTDNIITVYVDHSRYADSRWYTGSGIYRNVKLITTKKLHIPIWGTYITTPEVTKNKATINLQIDVKNDFDKDATYQLNTEFFNQQGIVVAKVSSEKINGKANQKNTFSKDITIKYPELWCPENPSLYKAVTTIQYQNKIIDSYETTIGIRSVQHNKKDGLLINGKQTLVKGVCLHHDAGIVGTAVPKGVWRRRLQILKEGGVNAIRTSHNPFSKEFLDLCDEMGFLVQAEIFDEFDYPKDKRLNYHERKPEYITTGYTKDFQKWNKSDLTRTILRDRNHPSIFEWSIGNEIEWTYLHYRYATGFWKDKNDPQNSGNYWGSPPFLTPEETKARFDKLEKSEYNLAKTAKKINNWVKELDTTRATTANLVVPQTSHISGYADAVDIVGYSYRNLDIPWANKYFPHKQITINECPGSWEDWETVLNNPEVFSMYMWTGIAYMGEAHKSWPKKAWYGDMLNLAGFKNQGFNYFKSIWVDEPHVSMGTIPVQQSGFKLNKKGDIVAGSKRWRNTNMHWNYNSNDSILVEVNTNQEAVELFLNDVSLGTKKLAGNPDKIIRWLVPFKGGKLVVKVVNSDAKAILETADKPTQFSLVTDKKILKADGYDVAHLVLQLKDKQNRNVKTFNKKVTFTIDGAAKLLGVDNGLANNIQDFQSNTIVTGDGRCLLLVQSKRNQIGSIKITAAIEGFEKRECTLQIK
ncbi:glycoside hydrolase family 2 TIM barrel-domain containing protein [Polaribacter marinivivus]|uniref:glycoside hydrolase family 2 TIM barrel-domain containing protein n=1 Tax=Polaribacter marinivivus TaxID=1524260 RepID=UPI003D33F5D3